MWPFAQYVEFFLGETVRQFLNFDGPIGTVPEGRPPIPKPLRQRREESHTEATLLTEDWHVEQRIQIPTTHML